MKKLALAMSIACAGALAFADNPQWNTPSWFTGIGTTATGLDALGATNGSWAFPDDNAGVDFDTDSTAIVFELDDGVESVFTVGDAKASEKTAQKIVVNGVFVPCSESDLTTGAKMNEAGAQLGFAVVTATESDATVYKYYAWVGGTDGDAPINDWVEVGTCTDTSAATELTITISYWGGSPKATFSAVNGENDAVTLADQELTSTAATANRVSSVACTGSGTLSALSGETAVAVASVGDVAYGTVADAIAAATDGATVTLLANPDGDVTISAESTVKIDDNGKTASIINNGTMNIVVTDSSSETGVKSDTYTYPVTASGDGKIEVVLNDDSKEAAVVKGDKEIVVTVQTAKSVLEAITIEGATLKSDISKLRTFLAANCSESYTAANTTSDDIATELKATGGNKLTKWQSYALGISPSTSIAASYATDDATDAVTIALALSAEETISPSGDFTISYDVYSGDTKKKSSESPSAIKVPLETGRYSVKVVFTAPES